MTSRFFANRGMTIGIDDVTPDKRLLTEKKVNDLFRRAAFLLSMFPPHSRPDLRPNSQTPKEKCRCSQPARSRSPGDKQTIFRMLLGMEGFRRLGRKGDDVCDNLVVRRGTVGAEARG